MPLIRVSEASVKTMLLKVDTSKASGPDGITPKVLQSWLFPDDCILYKSYTYQKETDSLQEDLNKLGT